MKLLFLFGILFVIIVTIFGAPLNNSEEEEECVDKSKDVLNCMLKIFI